MSDSIYRDWRPVQSYEPCDAIRKGDIILWNGRPRTVRAVGRSPDDAVRSVTFAILRRSWTNRPYTVYTRTELKKAFGGIIARRKDSDLCATDNECRTQADIEDPEGLKRRISASEMVGTVW